MISALFHFNVKARLRGLVCKKCAESFDANIHDTVDDVKLVKVKSAQI